MIPKSNIIYPDSDEMHKNLLSLSFLLLLFLFIFYFLVPSVVKIPWVKNIKFKSNMKWLTFGVIPIDEGASESNLIETLD